MGDGIDQRREEKTEARQEMNLKRQEEGVVPVVVVVDEEGIVSLAIPPRGVGEGHPLVALVHRPHPELHCHSSGWEVVKVCDEQHLSTSQCCGVQGKEDKTLPAGVYAGHVLRQGCAKRNQQGGGHLSSSVSYPAMTHSQAYNKQSQPHQHQACLQRGEPGAVDILSATLGY